MRSVHLSSESNHNGPPLALVGVMELVDEEERVMRAWLMEKLPLAPCICMCPYEYERGRRQFWQRAHAF
jgi:hypothetical protein